MEQQIDVPLTKKPVKMYFNSFTETLEEQGFSLQLPLSLPQACAQGGLFTQNRKYEN